MRVLVTGAKGMLGQDLCPILEDAGFEVIEAGHKNLDITKFEDVEKYITEAMPEYIVHCAAYTDVEGAEDDFDMAMLINAKGTENLAKICANYKIPLIYISTDYVFDGTKISPYIPSDTPNPVNKYGLTKLKGEEAVLNHCEKYCIIRTSWLYGHHGKNFVESLLAQKDNKSIRVVDDQIGCPTWTIELANGIVRMINQHTNGICHICGGGETSRYEFAKEIFNYAGIDSSVIHPCKSEEFKTKANRPKYSVMDNNKICRHWREALHDYLDLRPED